MFQIAPVFVILVLNIKQGIQKLAGNNFKVAWAEFSTISWGVFIIHKHTFI
jgi:hypothetical protein